MNRPVVVLDTNVLLEEPNALYAFPDTLVLLPIVCIEEIDKFKKDLNGIGRNAREASRQLDKLRQHGSLAAGVPLKNGGEMRIVLGHRSYHTLARDLSHFNDNYILAVAMEANANPENGPVTLVTKDTNMRLKADALGIVSRDWRSDEHVQIEELYTGVQKAETDGANLDRLFAEGRLELPEVACYPNQYVLLSDRIDPQHVGLSRFDIKAHALVPVRSPGGVWGITPRNMEQRIALDLLMNDDIPLVTLVGKAGTGKTLLALAAGLRAAVDLNRYTRLLVSRPIFPMGRDIGFLPGELQDKLKPWMQPIHDNLEFLVSGGKEREGVKDRNETKSGDKDHPGRRGARDGESLYRELFDMKLVVVEPLTYIRGRSIPNQYFIVDEAQNLTPHEIKTIISRAGQETKMVLTGDPYQIDNPYLDSSSNGLAYVAERMKGSPLAGHITLQKGERSPLAQAAADLL